MKKPKVTITVMEEETGYSAHIKTGIYFIGVEAETLKDLWRNLLEAVDFTFNT